MKSGDRYVPILNQLGNLSTKNLKELQAEISDIIEKREEEACPFCDEPTISREGKYGEFIGCSAYPKCNYSRSLRVTKEWDVGDDEMPYGMENDRFSDYFY